MDCETVILPEGAGISNRRRLLKNAHLLRCAANLIAQRMPVYASLFGFVRALHLSIFEQPVKQGVLQHLAA
jgi:hypothetical protein